MKLNLFVKRSFDPGSVPKERSYSSTQKFKFFVFLKWLLQFWAQGTNKMKHWSLPSVETTSGVVDICLAMNNVTKKSCKSSLRAATKFDISQCQAISMFAHDLWWSQMFFSQNFFAGKRNTRHFYPSQKSKPKKLKNAKEHI